MVFFLIFKEDPSISYAKKLVQLDYNLYKEGDSPMLSIEVIWVYVKKYVKERATLLA